eukprot:CAMPEP_0196578096 /NCGR_PEP_ID=MMETSP1081-20130531/7069_1 /TAXON_ID=36882 /ORGANISM="Pyramimonas amylifera, Strain CCMP720" /LENGTH=104 /DNA_ID=CAMNT_0041897215 /DNA_START=174 /DNA_END=488 /DNA_ORIENTATION=+
MGPARQEAPLCKLRDAEPSEVHSQISHQLNLRLDKASCERDDRCRGKVCSAMRLYLATHWVPCQMWHRCLLVHTEVATTRLASVPEVEHPEACAPPNMSTEVLD